MSVESPFQLKHTNVSRPQLVHSDSQQSIAASEDYYYSLSEKPSSASDEPTKPVAPRYHTPPSRIVTPEQSHDQLPQTDNTTGTYLKGVGRARQHGHLQAPAPGAATSPGNSSNHSNNNNNSHASRSDRSGNTVVSTILQDYIDSKPEDADPRQPPMERPSPSTTPGMDETPYIRFAIDQLTRDEEVRGSRHYPAIAQEGDDVGEDEDRESEDYPVERIVSDEGLGYMQQEEEKERRLSRARPPPSTTATRTSTAPVPPRPATRPRSSAQPEQQDAFVAFHATGDSFQHAPLRFKPAILKPLWMGIFILLCSAMLAALIFCAIYSNRNDGVGIWTYRSFGDVRYFIFEYLPTIVGMILLLWLFQVQTALQRTLPFASMASESAKQRSEAIFLSLYPMQFLVPNLEYLRAGQPLVFACHIIFWLFVWTVPLLSAAFNVGYILPMREWRWVATQGVIWTIVVLYALLILALVFLTVFLLRKETGLKWDPRSLADMIALLERANIMNDYEGTETFDKNHFRQRLAGRADRIGYWRTSKRPNDIFYGFGEEGGPTRRYSVEEGRIREKGPGKATAPPTQPSADFSIRMDIRSARVRLRYLPWYLRDTSVVAWIVIAVILFIAFLVVSYINQAVREGFVPQLPSRTNKAGFSASNFLYSFIPALIGHILFLVLLSLDYSIRVLQPYMSLSRPGGATAESSLLVDYVCRFPLSVTVAALENRHFQTVVLSLVSLASATLPILAGGCFWTQYHAGSSRVRVSADMPGYYALCFFLALYVLGLFALLPGRRRATLPHAANSIAEIVSWVYQSQILTDRAFNRPQTKPDLVARLMGSEWLDRPWMRRSLTQLVRPSGDNLRDSNGNGHGVSSNQEKDMAASGSRGHHHQVSTGTTTTVDPEKRQSVMDPAAIRYGFGIHVGRDGLEHLGIDRVRRGGERSGRELVIWEEMQKSNA